MYIYIYTNTNEDRVFFCNIPYILALTYLESSEGMYL